MATFEARVTQEGWSFEFRVTEEDKGPSIASVEKIAAGFIDHQTALQAEGQRFIRQTLEATRETFPPEPNGQVHTEEAETLSDEAGHITHQRS